MISSVEELLILILWILPGFIGFIVQNETAVNPHKYDNFDKLMWSLFNSLVAHPFVYLIFGIGSLDVLITRVFEPFVLAALLLVPICIGYLIGRILKRNNKNVSFGDCWLVFNQKMKDQFPGVTVFTSDGREIIGQLHYASREKVDKEIIVSDPILILRNREHIVESQMSLGKEMFFSEKNISRISFWEEI